VRSAAVSESGGAFVTADESGRLRVALTDLARGPEVAPSGVLPLWHVPLAGAPAAAVRATAVAADGGTVFAATDREIFAWVVSPYWGKLPPAGSVLTRMGPLRPAQIPTPGPVSAMAVDRTGRVLATVDPEGVRVWELGTGLLAPGGRFGRPQPRLLPGTAGAREVVFDPKGGRLAVAAGRGVRVLDLSGAVLAEAPDAHGADVGAVAFDPAGARLATGDADGLIRVWAVGPGGLEPRARVAGHAGGVLALGFSPDGRTLASGGADRAVVLWDPETGQERAALTGHADQVVRVRFAADGGKLFTVGRDGAARRWQAEPRAKSPPAAPAPLAAPARRR